MYSEYAVKIEPVEGDLIQMPSPQYAADWQKLCIKAKAVYPPVCHLCLREIDLRLSGRHKLGWSLDHLDPVALTQSVGVPSLERVRPAHLSCNASRGAGEAKPRARSRDW